MVVLPAPFGPIRPRISSWWTVKVTSVTALIPPNRLVRPDTSRTGVRTAAGTAVRSRSEAEVVWPLIPLDAPCRNTERRMSSRSSSSAVGPEKRTSPFSMK